MNTFPGLYKRLSSSTCLYLFHSTLTSIQFQTRNMSDTQVWWGPFRRSAKTNPDWHHQYQSYWTSCVTFTSWHAAYSSLRRRFTLQTYNCAYAVMVGGYKCTWTWLTDVIWRFGTLSWLYPRRNASKFCTFAHELILAKSHLVLQNLEQRMESLGQHQLICDEYHWWVVEQKVIFLFKYVSMNSIPYLLTDNL